MENALQSVLVEMPQAAGIWLLLLAVAVVAGAVLVAPRRAAAGPAAPPAAPPADPADPADAELGEAARYAEEVAVAADRAAVTARRRHAEWIAAEAAVEVTWKAFEAADAAWRRAAGAAAYAEVVAASPAECERYLHRSATAACRRRELPMADLSDVLTHRNGWDPSLHPAAQEAALRRAVRDRRLAAHLAATEAERLTWRAADLAAAALSTLREEAFEAAFRAETQRPSGAADWLDAQLSLDVAAGVTTVPIARGEHALAG
ncbi:hypothetical protein [Spirilliplanes yamanashiensis]|nr:hypothetical protein [Spirilliplanes yamanashiensis]MDP9818864.1 hypothetical protein [Spirilliplanes yamanashiensis]